VLELVAPQALVAAFSCVLLEQQVLLHSSSLGLLTATAEFLTACLYPLAWCHVYIPVLPRHCEFFSHHNMGRPCFGPGRPTD
jgi:hypothetical protein